MVWTLGMSAVCAPIACSYLGEGKHSRHDAGVRLARLGAEEKLKRKAPSLNSARRARPSLVSRAGLHPCDRAFGLSMREPIGPNHRQRGATSVPADMGGRSNWASHSLRLKWRRKRRTILRTRISTVRGGRHDAR